METGRRKKFCLTKRVEEYRFIESESSEQSNSEEDYSSICKIFHQKALKRSRQLEIEEKFKNEFQRREASIAKYPGLMSSDEDSSTTNTYSTRASSNRITSTPRVASALRPINKSLAFSQIETNQTLPHSFQTVNQSHKHTVDHTDYQEPFTNARTVRKSTVKRRQSAIPFERLRQLANDSPYMSPLSPNPAQTKRMKRRATMMSTFKTYCEINTQTSPLEEQRGRKSITFNEGLLNGDKSDSSASVISFSKALVDEPEDIYSNVESRNELKLSEQQKSTRSNRTIDNVQPNRVSSRSNLSRRSSSHLDNHLDINSNSFSFEPPVQSDKRSTIVPSFKTPSLSKKSLASSRKSITLGSRNSEIVSDRVDPTETSPSPTKSRSRLSKRLSKAASPTSPPKSKSLTKSLHSKSLNSSRKSFKVADSEIKSIALDASSGQTSSRRSTKSVKNSAINTLPCDLAEPDEEDWRENASLRTSRLSIPPVASTPKASSTRNTSRSSSRNSSLIEANGRKSEIASRVSTFVEANGRKSEIASPSAQILNGDSEVKSLDQSSASMLSQPSRPNSEIKSVINSSTNSNQESSSAASYKSASDIFPDVTANGSEIITSDESNTNESNHADHSAESSESSKSMEVEESCQIQVNNHSAISLATNIATTSADDSIQTANKESSEIFTNHVSDLDSSMANSENNGDQSAIPNFSLNDDYGINEDFNSISRSLNKEDDDQRYSKIEDKEKQEEANDGEEEDKQESINKKSVDLNNEESKRDENESISKNEALSDLKNSSFSRIEPNISEISISFEPSICNSTENQLDKNPSELASERDDDQASTKTQDSEFKVPAPPKRQANRPRQGVAIQKQQPKFYETMVNKTPTIIYPQTGEGEEADEEDGSVRRSNRIRVKPLEYWRNQKLKYKIDSETKCFTIDGVEKGFKPENPFSKKITRSAVGSNKRKLNGRQTKLPKVKQEESSEEDESGSSSEETESSSEEEQEPVKRVRYAPNEESIHQPVNESAILISEKIKKEAAEFHSKQDLVWNPSKQSAGVFIALMNRKKSPKTGTQASGFIKMEPFAEKPRQTSADYLTKYVVMLGAVSVQIGEKPTVFLKGMDSFTVDKHTPYSIRNLRKDESLLYFDVCRSN